MNTSCIKPLMIADTHWEYRSLSNLISHLQDEERKTVEFSELEIVSRETRISISKLRKQLKICGIEMLPRPKMRSVRGFNSNDHDRWNGPGSEPTHGGSGFSNRE